MKPCSPRRSVPTGASERLLGGALSATVEAGVVTQARTGSNPMLPSCYKLQSFIPQ